MLARSYRNLEPFDTAVAQLRDYVERLISDGSTAASLRSQSTLDTTALKARDGQSRMPDGSRKDTSHDV